MASLGIDFGTSNTAAAVLVNGNAELICVEDGRTVLPTSIFFDYHSGDTLYGSAANTALIDGREGHFMRALKSVLGTPLARETRQIHYERLTLIEAIARFLRMIREQAEATTGQAYDHALSGRPVKFHSADAKKNAQAEIDLNEAYLLAGFKSVDFLFEPEAAALSSGELKQGKIGLVVDIGGGTSDFSIFTREGKSTKIVASHGVRVGGTDFDKAISLSRVMPLLGRGAEIRNEFGKGTHTAPNSVYNELAAWEKIQFLYTADMRRMAASFHKLGVQPLLFKRLSDVLELELGHDIAFAVEDGKIALNAKGADQSAIDLNVVEKSLAPRLTNGDLMADLADHATTIHGAAIETLNLAGLSRHDIEKIVLVGGSSLMGIVEGTMRGLFPNAEVERSAAFTAVASGLAIAAAS